jgi:penicillin-binding protein-related factor A (putative recombinase)
MTRDNSAIGRLSQQVGEAFETWIDGQHDFALMQGILAHVEHNQAKTKVIGGRLQYVSKGTSDYTGVLDRIARAFAAETKSCKAKSFPRKQVKKKQQEHLTAVARAGGLALLVLEFRCTTPGQPYYQRFAVPWLEVPWETKRSAESVSAAALTKWLITPGTCYLERFHAKGTPTTVRRGRVYARE